MNCRRLGDREEDRGLEDVPCLGDANSAEVAPLDRNRRSLWVSPCTVFTVPPSSRPSHAYSRIGEGLRSPNSVFQRERVSMMLQLVPRIQD